MSGRLDYHDPFHEFAGRLTEALEDNHLVVSGYAFLVDVDHMSREYRYVVHLESEPPSESPRTFAWPWAELRFLVDALSFGRHIAEYDEGVEFSKTVHEEVQVFGELVTEIMMDRLLVPPDVVGLRRAIVPVSNDPGVPSISLQQHFSTEDAPPVYSARVQSSIMLKEDELVDPDRPRKLAAAAAAILNALQGLRLPAEGAPLPPGEE
ncbi:MAG: hypothetical protein E6H00_07625 [Bacillati bacterium ANGP1]|uniref:Uncharacterized protein n=1 Tax=Candidatus Segetimicrobium genomatis TaxID=2569760 RepID=A0A537K3H1_9BACT|nr:MAG: hypothetical protein E6H00_07625 [Terrabacteria group bacterium ANGP1]